VLLIEIMKKNHLFSALQHPCTPNRLIVRDLASVTKSAENRKR